MCNMNKRYFQFDVCTVWPLLATKVFGLTALYNLLKMDYRFFWEKKLHAE